MNPTELLISVVTLAVLYCSKAAYTSYLQNRKEVRLREIESAEKTAILNKMEVMSKQETKRIELLSSIIVLS